MSAITSIAPPSGDCVQAQLDVALERLSEQRQSWANLPVGARIDLLKSIRNNLARRAADWVAISARDKGLDNASPLLGEEWSSGPWALLTGIDTLQHTLSGLEGRRHLDGLRIRTTVSGQVAVRVFPMSVTDRLLLSGVEAEVWMEPDISATQFKAHAAGAYSESAEPRRGSLALVLGAGNITSIAPLDALHKLYSEHSVVLLKLNPVTASLLPVFADIFAPLIEKGFLEIVNGDAEVGAYLTTHPTVESIHITGSAASHDAIVFGPGEEGATRKARGTPLNNRPITSELGAVCPTIVVPGEWTAADLRFQAQHVATQKLHNSGFNCVASQVLVLPKQWVLRERFLEELHQALVTAPPRPLYYPGSHDRLASFKRGAPTTLTLKSPPDAPRLLAFRDPDSDAQVFRNEVFGPALCVVEIDGETPGSYLQHAIDFANHRLHGTLGANIIIDPETEKALKLDFELMLSTLKYGTVGVNAWTGLAFLLAQVPWGAFPGHTLDDIQSGRGFVHNCLLLDRPQRSIVRAPFRPFPRGLLHGDLAFLPRPPWFVNNRSGTETARRLVEFQLNPSLLRLLRIFTSALSG
ncbi:aldehyde dehydrogenase family protein [Pseudomonas sp. J452]|uniref:aldehyde dehydrogenase family protein n=1 Tax=Pseudomonas sp. J452 TaxID=2898441 RepID=UPI0021ADD363|nr:aldehyde dehydrogenase family protein [Pseudomonas sp. J452]UUY08652.1 aldehyde dehydrogenase family protein [Pseudomonas sp. J452]